MKSRELFYVLVVAFVILVSLAVYLILVPTLDDLKAIDRALTVNQATIAAKNQKIKMIPGLHQSLNTIERQILGLKNRLVDRDSLALVLLEFSKLAKKFDVTILSASFATDSLSADPDRKRLSLRLPVVLELEGRYLDFGMFVEHLDRLPFSASPDAVLISGQEQNRGELSITFDVAIFVRIEGWKTSGGEKNNG